MARLEILGHSTIYRNPHPNHTSEYVAFPAIQALPDDTLLCMCRHGSARESDEGVVKIYRSTDGGDTWQATGPLPEMEAAGEGIHLPGGFGVSPQGEVLAWVCYPLGSEGESGQLVSRSADGGLTWSEFSRVDVAPFDRIGVGGNLVTLADGTMVSVSEWGEQVSGDKKPDWASLISSSSDSGRTWEEWRRVHGPQDGIYFFDMRITGLADNRLLAAYWTHDMEKDQGINVHTSWSTDGGATWSEPQDAGFLVGDLEHPGHFGRHRRAAFHGWRLGRRPKRHGRRHASAVGPRSKLEGLRPLARQSALPAGLDRLGVDLVSLPYLGGKAGIDAQTGQRLVRGIFGTAFAHDVPASARMILVIGVPSRGLESGSPPAHGRTDRERSDRDASGFSEARVPGSPTPRAVHCRRFGCRAGPPRAPPA